MSVTTLNQVRELLFNQMSLLASALSAMQNDLDIESGRIDNLSSNLNNKVDKVNGKGLSANDYTTAEKNKLAGLENYTLTKEKVVAALGYTPPSSDTNTDVNVKQTNSTANNAYPILLKNGTGTGEVTTDVLFNSNITINPSTNTITATNFEGTATQAVQDASGNVISKTYETKANAITGLSVNGNTITVTKGDGKSTQITLDYDGDDDDVITVSLVTFDVDSPYIKDASGNKWTRMNNASVTVSNPEEIPAFKSGGTAHFKMAEPIELGGCDFTIEAWAAKTANSTYCNLLLSTSQLPTPTGNNVPTTQGRISIDLYNNKANVCYSDEVAGNNNATNWAAQGATALMADKLMHHIAVIYRHEAGKLSLYIDGEHIADTETTRTIPRLRQYFYIGVLVNAISSGYSFQGYIYALKISDGIAKWKAPFTPPAIPDGTSVKTQVKIAKMRADIDFIAAMTEVDLEG